MPLWIPKNKKTGMEYPPFTDAEKAAYMADPLLAAKYTFTAVPGSDKQPAPAPIEAKPVAQKPKEEKD